MARIVKMLVAPALIMSLVSATAYADMVPGRDQSFLNRAAEASQAQVSASKLALEKTSNPDIKSLATLILDEHTTLRDDLGKLAHSKDVSVPEQAGMTQRARIAILEKLSGRLFDQQYLSMMALSGQRDDLSLFSKAALNARDPDVRNFALQAQPNLQRLLDMAMTARARVEAGNQTSKAHTGERAEVRSGMPDVP